MWVSLRGCLFGIVTLRGLWSGFFCLVSFGHFGFVAVSAPSARGVCVPQSADPQPQKTKRKKEGPIYGAPSAPAKYATACAHLRLVATRPNARSPPLGPSENGPWGRTPGDRG